MKKLKMILPMLAFVLAIGVSFAFVETSAEKDYYANQYIQVPGGWATISVVCFAPQDMECLVQYTDDPLAVKYPVYNSKNTLDPAKGDGIIIKINTPVPQPD